LRPQRESAERKYVPHPDNFGRNTLIDHELGSEWTSAQPW
jgi:hypothetical protein